MPEIINGQPSAAEVQSHIDTDTPATLLNTTHRGLVAGNPHVVTRAELSLATGDSVTFANCSVGTGELTTGSINRASGSLTLEIGGVAQATISNSVIAFAHKLTVGSFASPIDVTGTRKHGVELHYSGNNYDVTAIRARAHLITTNTSGTAQGALIQAANSDNVDVGCLNGALIEAIGKATANAAAITMMRGLLVGAEWSAKDTVVDLRTLHVRTHTRDAATEGYVSGTGYGLYIENEAVGGNGQALDAGIYFKGTNLSGGNNAYTLGIDFSGATITNAEIKGSNGEIISNTTDGTWSFGGRAVFTPGANSTTAFRWRNAAEAVVLDIDTTNKRVGINRTPGAALDVIGAIWFGTSQADGQFTTGSVPGAQSVYLTAGGGTASGILIRTRNAGGIHNSLVIDKDAKVGLAGVTSPAGILSIGDLTEGSTGSLNFQTAHETHTLAAAGTSDTSIDIPAGCKLLFAQFTVNTAVSDDGGNDTWSAEFHDGASMHSLAAGAAAAQNTKVNTYVDARTVSTITDAVTNIRFTANGGSFDGGVIEVVVYYQDATSMANV